MQLSSQVFLPPVFGPDEFPLARTVDIAPGTEARGREQENVELLRFVLCLPGKVIPRDDDRQGRPIMRACCVNLLDCIIPNRTAPVLALRNERFLAKVGYHVCAVVGRGRSRPCVPPKFGEQAGSLALKLNAVGAGYIRHAVPT